MTPRTRASASSAVLFFLSVLSSLASRPLSAETVAPGAAVVTGPVENVTVRPDATSEVDDQLILGETVETLEETAGFTKVRCASGTVGWVPARSLVRGVSPPSPPVHPVFEVVSGLAHLYRDPSFTTSRPLLTTPLASRLEVVRSFEKEGHAWSEVRLPDGRRAFAASTDLAPLPARRPVVLDPAAWLAMAKGFLGAPYTWGGTTPYGFDCSGLATRVLERHGIRLKRNSGELCFQEPQLVPVRFEDLRPGDLLFFGTDEAEAKIDHMAFWAGDGTVIQATAYGVPGTQVTRFAGDARLEGRFRYARRLGALPGATRPVWTESRRAALEARLREMASVGSFRFGVVFKELQTGSSIRFDEKRVMHAASTVKTGLLLELLRRVDARTLKLTDAIDVRNEFKSLADGSPFTVELDADSEGPVAAKLGQKAPIGFLAREMIVRSSNLATNLLLQHVGAEAVQRFLDELGAPTVRFRRGMFDMKAFDKGVFNETDASGMAALIEAAVRSPKLSEASRKLAWDFLAAQTFNEEIPAGLPRQSGVLVAHKTGSISTVQHDAAVVRLPDGRDYVLVLLADNFKGEEERKKVLEVARKMSRAVWEAMIDP